MGFAFEAPVGAAADLAELEYVAALVQTDHSNRDEYNDGSIEAVDVKHHLLSRYGIVVSKEQVKASILSGLGGGDSDEDCIDICELVAVLIVPFLRRIVAKEKDWRGEANKDCGANRCDDERSQRRLDARSPSTIAKNGDDGEPRTKDDDAVHPKRILSDVLRNILLQATGSDAAPAITHALIRRMFAAYDELDLVDDDGTVEGMVTAASGGNPDAVLDVDAFARALTNDVALYDPAVEDRRSTHFYDALGGESGAMRRNGGFSVRAESSSSRGGKPSTTTRSRSRSRERRLGHAHGVGVGNIPAGRPSLRIGGEPVEEALATTGRSDEEEDGANAGGRATQAFTFASIDMTAETYRNKSQALLVWACVIFGYMAYFFQEGEAVVVCDDDSLGCAVGQGVFQYTIVMLVLSVLGTVYVVVLSSGNDAFRDSPLDVLVGFAGLGFFFVVPAVVKVNGRVFSTERDHGDDEVDARVSRAADIVYWVVGAFLFLCHVKNAIRLFFSHDRIAHSKILSRLLAGSSAKDELDTKRAASHKVNRMVMNAYILHQENAFGEKRVTKSSHAKVAATAMSSSEATALLNYTKVMEKRETVGGFAWAWRNFLNGRLASEEGVRISARLMAGNGAQFLVTFLVLFFFGKLGNLLIEEFYSEPPPCDVTFDPNKCYFPTIDGTANGTHLGIAVCKDVAVQGEECKDGFYPTPDAARGFACEVFEPLLEDEPCPDLYSAGYTAYTPDSDREDEEEKDFCAAQVAVCFTMADVNNLPVSFSGSCILGMNKYLIPFQFDGAQCSSIDGVNEMLADKPAEHMESYVEETEDDIKPKEWMVRLSFAVGILTAAITGLYIALVYTPSAVSTILQFRTGVIPSLKDKGFLKYRKSLESVAYLSGGIIWGLFFSVFLCVLIFAGITFLLVWQVTRPVVIVVLGLVIGISCTLVFKSVMVLVLDTINYAGYFRKRPWLGNICGVALECWHLGITVGYMLVRMIKLMTAAALSVGRVDKPILADGAGTVGSFVDLDLWPTFFRKSLLSTDAHRHPYIERLGFLNLMKLKNGEDFGSRAGSIWRLLFVFALMPWLRKYRIARDPDIPERFILQKLALGSKKEHTQKQVEDLEQIVVDLKHEVATLEQKIAMMESEK